MAYVSVDIIVGPCRRLLLREQVVARSTWEELSKIGPSTRQSNEMGFCWTSSNPLNARPGCGPTPTALHTYSASTTCKLPLTSQVVTLLAASRSTLSLLLRFETGFA
jgi:hypothetical protein